jgi:chromosome segregation ATPase
MTQTLEMPKLLEKQIDRLYSLPVDGFTAARNDLARGLKASGDREGAERVRKLEKPTVVAWTVNQLARRTQRELRDLFSAVDTLREAQNAALAGGGSSEVRAAAEAERAALQVLVARAKSILEAEERRQAGVVERVAATLRGGAVNAESRALLESGRLTHELEPAGFGGLTGLVLPDAPPEHPSRRHEDREARRRAARERLKGLQSEVQELRRVVKAAEGRVRDAEREAERAHREAEEARTDLQRVESDLEAVRAEIETH